MKHSRGLLLFGLVFALVALASANPLSRLQKRQCETNQCIDLGLKIAGCIQQNPSEQYAASKCLCNNKPAAMACYATCTSDADKMTEQEFGETCAFMLGTVIPSATVPPVTSATETVPAQTTQAATSTATSAPVQTTSKPSSAGRTFAGAGTLIALIAAFFALL